MYKKWIISSEQVNKKNKIVPVLIFIIFAKKIIHFFLYLAPQLWPQSNRPDPLE
jgi:hypothetical protein